MIAHILLLPHPAHRERLLAPGCLICTPDGRFGWVVTLQGTPWIVFDDGGAGRRPNSRDRLVLARDGAVCPEGVDRLVRAERAASPAPWSQAGPEGSLRAILSGMVRIANPAMFPLGTLVLIDADGREVVP